mmetsp:Transcript_66296/g.198036  ORF Transcript_66296/g.198036 Transcript_66296/m.198036 type:complete len:2091 (+) Transcript_66296:2828-9100(+)
MGGSVAFGVDCVQRDRYAIRFGAETFHLGDALDRELLRSLIRRYRPTLVVASPPCQGSSTATFGNAPSRAPHLISETRDLLRELGVLFVIENVRGAAAEMRGPLLVLRGNQFGLRTDRTRLFEPGGGLQLEHDPELERLGARLRLHCCLGGKARYPRLDPFGRPIRRACCEGNIYTVVGASPSASTLEENAAAMGFDAGHASYAGLAEAIPPVYTSFIFGLAVQHVLRRDFGLPVVSYAQMRTDPVRYRGLLRHWRRGGGGTSAALGSELLPAQESGRSTASEVAPDADATVRRGFAVGAVARDETTSDVGPHGAPDPWPSSVPPVSETCWRELDYSPGGGFDLVILEEGATHHAEGTRALPTWTASRVGSLMDHTCALVLVGGTDAVTLAPILRRALSSMKGVRCTLVVRRRDERWWLAALSPARGERLRSIPGLPDDCSAITFGDRMSPRGMLLDHEKLPPHMDPFDSGLDSFPKGYKAGVSWSTMPAPRPSAWAASGVPDRIVRYMTEGVEVTPYGTAPSSEGEAAVEDGAASVRPDELADLRSRLPGAALDPEEAAQYPWRDSEFYARGALECDRAMLAGHLERVPAHLVEWALSQAPAHPWTVVLQHGDKWRAAQDYSTFTNARIGSKPFTLPSVWDARRVVKLGRSHFAKYDLRDGFWSVPTHPRSRCHLMVRHPATGELLWCRSLPFGYRLSPLVFCDVTESVAALFRRRWSELRGIRRRRGRTELGDAHIFAFVDDFLIVGDDEETTSEAMALFETILDELALPWARHKRRGPARVMEFLGHLLVNLVDFHCIGLTASRQRRTLAMLDEWLARRPGFDEPELSCAPRELASFVGQLVFASEVIPGGRTFMQAMIRQFGGLEVDWIRGSVRCLRGEWRPARVCAAFWRDLVWLRSALLTANCTPLQTEPAPSAVIAGTDASDHACGELVWIDGAREESVLLFTHAEKRRPINFRELLGLLRVVQIWGPRLAGHTILTDIDNTCAFEGARKLHAKASDLQELLRQLYELCARYGIRVRAVHTPGRLLHRPDQTSRGATPEEPRLRVRATVFSGLAGRFGPFSEFLGAERHHPQAAARADAQRLWFHPTFATVATTLRLLVDRFEMAPSRCPRAFVLVPWDPSASWWGMTRHFLCVGRFGVGSRHLEESRLGTWVPVSSRRAAVLLSFPRAAGSASLPLSLMARRSTALMFGLDMPALISEEAPLPQGSLLYVPVREQSAPSAGQEGPDAGCLYVTTAAWDGAGRPSCMWARRRHRLSGARGDVFSLEGGAATARGGSFAEGGAPFLPEVGSLWLCNHLAQDGVAVAAGHARPGRAIRFDFSAAEVEIAELRELLATGRLHAGASSGSPSHESAIAALRDELDQADLCDDDDDESPISGYRRDSGGARAGTAREERRRPASPLQGARPSPPRRRRALSVTGQPLSRNTCGARRCAGCDGLLGASLVCPGGSGMIHNSSECARLAAARLAQRAELSAVAEGGGDDPPAAAEDAGSLSERLPTEEPPRPPEGTADRPAGAGTLPRTGSDQRRSQLRERTSQARVESFTRCLDGCCGVTDEAPMRCYGTRGGGACTATVHGMRCAQISKGFASLGMFLCPDCRLAAQVRPTEDHPDPSVLFPRDHPTREIATQASLVEMSRGAEATGASMADFAKLELEYMSNLASLVASVGGVLPRDDPEVFKLFLWWLMTSRERALSLDSIWRVAGSVMARTGRKDLTADAGVKAFYQSIRHMHGEESKPRTAATRRMVRAILQQIIDRSVSGLIRPRLRLMVALECMMGLRVGEALSGGDFHGLMANHLTILTNLTTGEETVEALLEHSKTKHKRWINAVGKSEGAAEIELARYLREYWVACGFSIVHRYSGNYRVEGPDYFVLRLSLLGLTGEEGRERLALACRLLSRSADPEARRWADFTLLRGEERRSGEHSMDKRYVNVVGGTWNHMTEHGTVAAELTRAGFGDLLSIVPGPLTRSTHGKTLGHSHMPLAPQSTYDTLHGMMDEAFRLSNPEGDRDPELDLQGLPSPLWGHHSFRRFADTCARQTMKESGATEQDIDLTFGWMEAFYSAKMQIHYESRFTRERRCCVTRLV